MPTPAKQRKPVTWTKENVRKLKCLQRKDRIKFDQVPNLYDLAHNHLKCIGDDNGRIFEEIGCDSDEYKIRLCSAAYGVNAGMGCCPEVTGSKAQILPRLTKLVKLLLIGGPPLARAIAKATGKTPPTKRELAAQAKAEKAAKAEAELKAQREMEAKEKAEMERAIALVSFSDQSRRVVSFFRANPIAFGCNREWVRGLCCALTGEEITAEMIK